MKLSLRYFLLVCLLLGALVLPVGHSWWKARRVAEIERLSKELSELRAIPDDNDPDTKMAEYFALMKGESFRMLTPSERKRIKEIEDRLAQLTDEK